MRLPPALALAGACLALAAAPALAQKNPRFEPHVPIGSILTTSVAQSPVGAGAQTSVTISMRVLENSGTLPVPLYVVFDLLGANGVLINRSDPTPLGIGGANGVRTVVVRYDVPLDGDGEYRFRADVQTYSGATVAMGRTIPLRIVAGPDPAPALKTEFKIDGPMEFGHRVGEPGHIANMSFTSGLEWATRRLSLSTATDPASFHLDPKLTFESRPTGEVRSPNATPEPQPSAAASPSPPPAMRFRDSLGRANVDLAPSVGGQTPVRGLDIDHTFRDYRLHGVIGRSEISSVATFGQAVEAFEAALHRAHGELLLTAMRRIDESTAPVGLADPLDARLLGVQLRAAVDPRVSVRADGGTSALLDRFTGLGYRGARDAFDLGYVRERLTVNAKYHNVSPAYVPGPGAVSTSDRSGGSVDLQGTLSPATTVNAVLRRDDTRSSQAFESDVTVDVNTAPSVGAFAFGLERNRQVAAGSNVTTDSGHVSFARTGPRSSLAIALQVQRATDIAAPVNDASTRTFSVQYQVGSGSKALALGLNSTAVAGVVPTFTTGTSLVLGLGGSKRVEYQLQGSSTNTRSLATGYAETTFGVAAALHLSGHVAAGVHYDVRDHHDLTPGASYRDAALRLRTDFRL